jgi:hypothetical protein
MPLRMLTPVTALLRLADQSPVAALTSVEMLGPDVGDVADGHDGGQRLGVDNVDLEQVGGALDVRHDDEDRLR